MAMEALIALKVMGCGIPLLGSFYTLFIELKFLSQK
jgi:hypothetical protein